MRLRCRSVLAGLRRSERGAAACLSSDPHGGGKASGMASPVRAVSAPEGGEPGVVITPRHDFSIACVIGNERRSLIERLFRVAICHRAAAIHRGSCRVICSTSIWSGPSQWLAWSATPGMPANSPPIWPASRAVTDQTDARAVLQLLGARVRDVLAKGCPVDLHPRAFRRGDTIITAIGGIGVQIWWADVDDACTLRCRAAWRAASGRGCCRPRQEFGVEVLPPKGG